MTTPTSSQPAAFVSGTPGTPGSPGSGYAHDQWPAATICGSRKRSHAARVAPPRAAVVAARATPARRSGRPPGPVAEALPAALLAWTWLGSTLANVAFFGRPWVALYGGLAMGLLVVPYLRALTLAARAPRHAPASGVPA